MPRQLPPLNALRAFEAAARSESFTRAAEELCVTQGAVSHQVKALEAELGLKLFNREQQGLVITEAGRVYLEVLRDAFDRIAVGTERLLQRQSAGLLTVSTSPNFAAKWLVHRLARFAELHPAIDLRIGAALHHIDFAREDVDLAIRHGDGQPNGLHMTRLCTEELMLVCNPKLLSGENALRTPADLAGHTLLHINDRNDWAKWLESAGVGNVDVARGPIFNQASMALDAAIQTLKDEGSVDFALLFCEPHHAAFYMDRGWKRFEGDVYAEQPGGRVRFEVTAPYVYSLKRAPLKGTIDLCGLPW